MTSYEPPRPLRCLIIGRQQTIHLLDERRSSPGKNWSKCSWPPSDESTVVLLVNAKQRYPRHVPCGECFPGRVLPEEAQS